MSMLVGFTPKSSTWTSEAPKPSAASAMSTRSEGFGMSIMRSNESLLDEDILDSGAEDQIIIFKPSQIKPTC
jgi:hypothetical protein